MAPSAVATDPALAAHRQNGGTAGSSQYPAPAPPPLLAQSSVDPGCYTMFLVCTVVTVVCR